MPRQFTANYLHVNINFCFRRVLLKNFFQIEGVILKLDRTLIIKIKPHLINKLASFKFLQLVEY